MKVHRSVGYIHIDLSFAEARVLLEELSDVRGGARMPKIRQVCAELVATLSLPPLVSRDGSVQRSATELGRLGGLKGGLARAAALSPEERTAAAKKAAEVRWGVREGKEDSPATDVGLKGESE